MRGTRVGAGLSTVQDAEQAAREASTAVRTQLGDRAVDLAVVFAGRSHLDGADLALAAVCELLSPRHLIGCCAQGVVGGDREIEDGAGTSVWAASLPGADVESFHLTIRPQGDEAVIEGMGDPEGSDLMLLLSDPFSFPADALLSSLAVEHPGLPVVGGIASGARSLEDGVLFLGREPLEHGAVGALLRGVDVLPCVSQGAAPIGPEMVVTAAEANLITELASKPALEKLSEVIADADPRERALASTGLLVGVVIDENKPAYERGDFLVRGLLGADREKGAIVVGERVRVGQTVRFHVRDEQSADADLREALARQRETLAERSAAGALLFTCNGRGRHMFSVANHDAGALAASLGSLPVSGFFCAGEIGPVGDRSFLHGFTATMALFVDG
jgi:small ligand-binding sensory domain FIST